MSTPVYQRVYVIKDKVSNQTTPLMLCNNDKHAEREFALFLSHTPLAPADFVMYVVGTFAPSVTDHDRPDLVAFDAQYVCSGSEIQQDIAFYERKQPDASASGEANK